VNEERAFRAAIAAHPDDDAPRLAFADWLDEHDRPAEAELVRVQIELEPLREDYGDARADALREREEVLLRPLRDRESQWLADLGCCRFGADVEYRRGFVDALKLPARWFVAHGAALRQRYPLLRKLVVFRLNGWGARFAACEHLRGVRELDPPCWYSDADADALAGSPHLSALGALHYWTGNWQANTVGQLRTLAASTAWPNLRRFRVVLGEDADRDLVNEAAGRAIGAVFDPAQLELFPMRADFSSGFLIGKFADGRQFFGDDPGDCGYDPATPPPPGPLRVEGQVFDAAGNPTETAALELPHELVYYPIELAKDVERHRALMADLSARRDEHLRAAYGFERAFIRVKRFSFRDFGPYRDPQYSNLGALDDPDADLATDYHGPRGYGESVYGAVTGEEYDFSAGNHWVCDKTGTVVFT
jgi:uncharacterized protein (TIGR02996 family)